MGYLEKMHMRLRAQSSLVLVLLLLGGCANYRSQNERAWAEYDSGRYIEAAQLLEKGAAEEGINQLLYSLDRGMALHQGGFYKEAVAEFTRADKLAEIKDYTSLAAEAATLVSTDRILPYKGEDFENVLISQYLALDYLMDGDEEGAQVENRRVNRKLYMMISEGKRHYQYSPLSRYLSGILFESAGQDNDAYIDYKAVRDLRPEFPFLDSDLYRTAKRSGLTQALQAWKEEHPEITKETLKQWDQERHWPELIILVEVGKAPLKQPHPSWHALPHFVPRPNPVDQVSVEIRPDQGQTKVVETSMLYDVETTAIENLKEKFAGILAKRIAGVVVKETVSYQVEKESPLLGLALRLGMYAADQADLRSWTTLPQQFRLARVRLPPGIKFELELKAANATYVTPIKRYDLDGKKKNQKIFVLGKVF